MTQSMLAHVVPVFRRQLKALQGWLDKAQAHAAARGFSPDLMLELRLAADMLPLVEQVHRSALAARNASARLAGQPAAGPGELSTTLADCRQYVQQTLDFLDTLPAEAMAAPDPVTVVLAGPGGKEHAMPAQDYVRHLALPNFFFHVTIAYALLRGAGLDVGKADYLG